MRDAKAVSGCWAGFMYIFLRCFTGDVEQFGGLGNLVLDLHIPLQSHAHGT